MTFYALAILLIVVLLAILFKVPKTKVAWKKGMWIGIIIIFVIGFIPFIILDLLKWPGEWGMLLGLPFNIPMGIANYVHKCLHIHIYGIDDIKTYHIYVLVISIIVYGASGAFIGFILGKNQKKKIN